MNAKGTAASGNTPGEHPPLAQLYCYLSEGCNLACTHCWLSPRHDPEGKGTFLPLQLLRTIIDESKPLGLTGVKLTGGEPLLHPDILAILDILRSEQLTLTMETNGVLCTPELAAAIARQQDPFVSVSLDAAVPEIHDKQRGVAGAFRRTVQGIRYLTAEQVPTQVIMSVSRENVDQIEPMINFAASMGVDSIKFNPIQPMGRGKFLHAQDHTLRVPELIALARRIDMELAPISPVQLNFDCPPAFKPLGRLTNDRGGCSVCGIFSILGVLATGHYALCGIGSHIPELIFGFAGRDPLATVWQDTPALREIRTSLPDKLSGTCGRCLMKHYCLGSCLAQNHYRSGTIWAPFWFCSEAEAMALFPASRLG